MDTKVLRFRRRLGMVLFGLNWSLVMHRVGLQLRLCTCLSRLECNISRQ